jgi:hypothetical protein
MGSILPMQWPVSELQRYRQFPKSLHVVAGALYQLHGRLSVIAGTLLHNDILRARGHRQQVIGLLQRFWRRDRHSVEAWVDALLKRSTPRHNSAKRLAWRPRPAAAILHQET